NILNHGAGWLEGGLTASFEKLIVDAEMLQMMVEYLKPLEVNDETLALDVIQDVGPGGHFFGTAHTLARYQNAFYEPLVSDRSNFERWREAGSLTVAERANVFWKQLLSEYQQPSLDPGIDEELTAFVAQRKEKLARAL
ncbi:MAG: methyltransferase, partial [Gammaproteobacteria bacterium]|nr:methyltransferase [Gammaproteobacteria bacterium]